MVCSSDLVTGQQQYFNNGSEKRIHIQKEYPFYFSGQELNLKVQQIDVTSYQLSEQKELVYILLKDKNDQTVFFEKLLVMQGTSRISIPLPSNIKTGFYELIGYTNWMRNFDDSYFFRDRISIYNIDETSENQFNIEPEGIEFFPEGQTIIEGITSRVAVKSTYQSDKSSIAFIRDDRDKLVAELNIDSSGWGSFYYLPKKDRSYVLQVVHDNNIKVHPLPKAELNGISLQVTKTKLKLKILVRKPRKHTIDGDITILATSNGELAFSSKGNLDKHFLLIELPIKEMPSGLLDILVLDQNNDPISSRSIIIGDESLDRMSITLQDSIFSTTESANCTLSNLKTRDDQAVIDVKIVPKEIYENEMYKLFSSLRGTNEDIRTLDPILKPSKLTDQLLAYSSSRATFTSKKESSYMKESYLYLKGILSDDNGVPNNTELSFFIPKINMVYHTKTDSVGKFEVPLLIEFKDKQKIHYYANSNGHTFLAPNITVFQEKVSSRMNLLGKPKLTPLVDSVMTEYLMGKKITESYQYYSKSEIQNPSLNLSIDEFFIPDLTVKMEEYYQFSSMTDIIKEILPGVTLRTKKGKQELRVYIQNQPPKNDPFIFINNMPTKDIEHLLSLKPTDIVSIKIISDPVKLSKMGNFGKDGIVIVETRQEKSITHENTNFTFETHGLSSFEVSEFDQELMDKPNTIDLRNILFWKTIPIKKESSETQIQFSTSHRPGDYVIVATLLGANGLIDYATKEFKVVKDHYERKN